MACMISLFNMLGPDVVGISVVGFPGLSSLKRLIVYSLQICSSSSASVTISLCSFLMKPNGLLLYSPAISLTFLWRWKLSPSLFRSSASWHLSCSQFSFAALISLRILFWRALNPLWSFWILHCLRYSINSRISLIIILGNCNSTNKFYYNRWLTSRLAQWPTDSTSTSPRCVKLGLHRGLGV